ncbi:hypothetical protein FA15DRAFT_707694 [Coprinopsis marcescibilis]|uniref:Uncharacterized protein n=1 Tax=Coprinopsis marcescibilis TaxID=230819 RepID=A0A5C3KLT3_COPMA|nr:hypothetical protein FA15DRAFT_707694 [Coprinopsis marcescibilis]
MMLVHKPTTFNIAPAVPHVHRRHPSAPPTVVVQPTKTPGLLSISKLVVRSSPQRHLPSNQRQGTPKSFSKPKQPAAVRAPASTEAHMNKKSALPPLQVPSSPAARGRGSKHAREKAQQPKRICSQSPLRGKHSRQPSPPIDLQMQQDPSQVEDKLDSSNLFDPFLDNSDSQLSEPQTPTRSKLSQRRQQRQLPNPVPVPVISPPKAQQDSMSRSEPSVSHMRSRTGRKFTGGFPICDDMNDEGVAFAVKSDVPTPPATPIRRQAFGDKSSLVNAPINVGFPFPYATSPSNNKGRKHRRAPSEGVFNMSSDEETSGPGGQTLNQNLFGYARRSPGAYPPTTPSPSFSRAGGAAYGKELNGSPGDVTKKAGYFASSIFQNSPSPDELPDPLLF